MVFYADTTKYNNFFSRFEFGAEPSLDICLIIPGILNVLFQFL